MITSIKQFKRIFAQNGGGGGGGLSGSGTTNYIPKWTPDGFTLGNSQIFDDGTNVGIGTTSPYAKFHISEAIASTGKPLLKVSFLYGDLINLDDASIFNYYGNQFRITSSNALLKLISNGGFNPTLEFKYNNDANYSGAIYGDGVNLIFNPVGNGGWGIALPTARLHVKGIDSTFNNFATKIDSSSDGIAHFRNDGQVELISTTGVLLLNRLTTTQKNALTPVNGMILYDSTLNKFQGYENGAWTNLI